MIAIGVIAALVVVGVAAAVVLSDDSDDSYDPSNPVAFDNVRLKVYGNANADDVLDESDKELVQYIVDCNSDDDTTNDVDWKTEYPFADANSDGKVDASDVDYIQGFLDGKSQKMYYFNKYDRVTYVNYPIGQKIGAEYLVLQLLPAIHSYGMLKAIDSSTPELFGNEMFPGVESLPVLGGWREMSIEGLTDAYNNGTIDTFIQWTGGQNTDYLWDDAEKSGLAEKISFVIVPCQGPDCIEGVLELACFLGDQSLSDEYKAWYDKALDLLDSIEEKIGSKKTITSVRAYSDKQSAIAAFGSDQGPALWFNKVVDFQDAYKGKTNFTTLGYEGFTSSATDEVIVMIQTDVAKEDFNKYVQDKFDNLFVNTKQYNSDKLYAISFEVMPYTAGPACCYILASYLYPDLFNHDDAVAYLQTYLDDFAVAEGMDANVGYFYAGGAGTASA